jgi:hypothetical protein
MAYRVKQPHLLVQNRNTLVGIVAGRVDCYNGYPIWYTKVALYRYVQNKQAKSCHIQGTRDQIYRHVFSFTEWAFNTGTNAYTWV